MTPSNKIFCPNCGRKAEFAGVISSIGDIYKCDTCDDMFEEAELVAPPAEESK